VDGSNQSGFNDPLSRLGWWYNRANIPANRAFGLGWLTKYVEAARRPIHEQPALLAAISDSPSDGNHGLTRLLLPPLGTLAHAHWRTTAVMRCAAVGIACERFRQQHNRWPDSLNELVPAFLPAIPLDPFDGQPLRYAKSKDTIAVYSVGKRAPTRPGFPAPDVTPKPGLPDGVEYGFRLWNLDERRLPPLPDPPPEREPRP
jgi:hypothetical protein